MSLLKPWLITKDINHICIDYLLNNGIKAIAFDKGIIFAVYHR